MRGHTHSTLLPSLALFALLAACDTKQRADIREKGEVAKEKIEHVVDTLEHKLSPDSTANRDGGDLNSDNEDNASGRITEVTLSDNLIDIDGELSAGERQFKVSNHGKMDHNFTIEGPGLKKTFTPRLRPDETRVMDVTLEPGIYTVYCPLDNHRYKGMLVKVSVH